MTDGPQLSIRQLCKACCLCFAVFLCQSPLEAIQDKDPPTKAGQAGSIGFRVMWEEVLRESGFDAELIAAPQQRKRKMFSSGMIVLDCCSTPEWRDLPEEKEVQLYSDVLFETKERYVFKRGAVQEIKDVRDLKLFRVAMVHGYSYPFEAFFGVKVEGRNIDDVLSLVEAGRAQIAIVSETDFLLSMKHKPRVLELGGTNWRAKLRARVHRSQANLLPPLNAAIARLRAKGRIEELILQEVTAREHP